jgi:hypothetical protein
LLSFKEVNANEGHGFSFGESIQPNQGFKVSFRN